MSGNKTTSGWLWEMYVLWQVASPNTIQTMLQFKFKILLFGQLKCENILNSTVLFGQELHPTDHRQHW